MKNKDHLKNEIIKKMEQLKKQNLQNNINNNIGIINQAQTEKITNHNNFSNISRNKEPTIQDYKSEILNEIR
jgi:hypothetical protein